VRLEDSWKAIRMSPRTGDSIDDGDPSALAAIIAEATAALSIGQEIVKALNFKVTEHVYMRHPFFWKSHHPVMACWDPTTQTWPSRPNESDLDRWYDEIGSNSPLEWHSWPSRQIAGRKNLTDSPDPTSSPSPG
jgi:hypothetical protein